MSHKGSQQIGNYSLILYPLLSETLMDLCHMCAIGHTLTCPTATLPFHTASSTFNQTHFKGSAVMWRHIKGTWCMREPSGGALHARDTDAPPRASAKASRWLARGSEKRGARGGGIKYNPLQLQWATSQCTANSGQSRWRRVQGHFTMTVERRVGYVIWTDHGCLLPYLRLCLFPRVSLLS